jgi:hypothetical protein
MKKLTTEDLLALAPEIALMPHDEQIKFIHKHNPYWKMPEPIKPLPKDM